MTDATQAQESVPKKMRPIFDEIVAITDIFCQEHLTESYAMMARKMAATLSRKRPSPLARGRKKSWAGGILYALAQVNFLWDPSNEPYMSATDLCEKLGVSKGTASNKAREIGDMFNIVPMDPRWCLPELMDDNPMAWMIQVNGFMMDARHASAEVQEIAFAKGLIPYVPYKKSVENVS